MKVLIIDDDESMIGIWTTVLKKEGIEVLTAGSGKLGIELAQKNVPDFILLDQIITDMKGNDVLKQLKSNPATTPIPVALVSNYSEPDMMHEAIENGATDYILKYQIDPADLANKIKTLLHGSKGLNPQSMPADPSTSSGQPTADPVVTAPIQQAVPAAPTIPQPQVIDPSASSLSANSGQAGQVPAAIPQPVVIDPNSPMQPSPVAQPATPVVSQPIVIDPTKPTQ